MLTGLLGIRIILKIGKSVLAPAPYSVMTALRHVQVTNETEGNDGFQMTFSLGKDKANDYSLLASGALDPDTRVAIGAILGVTIEPLIDGVIYHHQVKPSNEPGMSTLTVMGRDISIILDLETKNVTHKNQSDSTIATSVIGHYTKFGITPDVEKTKETPTESQRVVQQTKSDLSFLKDLAENNGFVFYIEPLTLGSSTAHWGPENRKKPAQPALSMNMGSATNVSSLDFAQDALSPIKATGSILDPVTKQSIKIPELEAFRTAQFAAKPITARRTTVLRCLANKSMGLASTRAVAAMTKASEPIAANGELDTVRYGHVLRARHSVTVSGAGHANDGLYKVQSVTHEIEPGKYAQRFTLSREGTGPT